MQKLLEYKKAYTYIKTSNKKLDNEIFLYKTMLGSANAKTDKGVKYGYLTGIMYLSPSTEAKQKGYNVKNTCNFESKECKKACLFSAGRGKFKNVNQARLNKTLFLLENTNILNPRINAIKSIIYDIKSIITKAKNKGLKPCIRLNGTSDLPIHKYGIIEKFENIQFYDYTKDYKKALDYANGLMPKNYHLTFSYTGHNALQCFDLLKKGVNVAIVFKNGLPKKFKGYNVINGDMHDLTFLHGKGYIIGLNAKGEAKKVENAFVIDNDKL